MPIYFFYNEPGYIRYFYKKFQEYTRNRDIYLNYCKRVYIGLYREGTEELLRFESISIYILIYKEIKRRDDELRA